MSDATLANGALAAAIADFLEAAGWDGRPSIHSIHVARVGHLALGRVDIEFKPFDTVELVQSDPPQMVNVTVSAFLEALRRPSLAAQETKAPVPLRAVSPDEVIEPEIEPDCHD